MRFTWDPRKAASNFRKHGVTFEEAATAFGDPLALFIQDGAHEDRMLIVGLTSQRRLMVVVHEEASDEEIRIISTRRPTPHERRRCEEGT